MKNKKPNAIDLFSGAGGFSEGILQSGFHILFSSDINEDVEKTYTNRHHQLGLKQGINTYYHRTDIRELTGTFIQEKINSLTAFKNTNPRIDVLFGGPPCQGFSRAGRRKQDDPRNMLFKEYLRVVNELQPSYVVMENVEGFMDTKLPNFIGLSGDTHPNDEIVPNILLNEFEKIGYQTLEPKILLAANYGVPQNRKRAIFIAYKSGLTAPKYPEPTHTNNKITIDDAISDLVSWIEDGTKISKLTDYQKISIKGRTPNINGTKLAQKSDPLNIELSNHSNYIVERFSLYSEGESTPNLRKRILSEGIDISNKPNLITLIENHESNTLTRQQIIDNFLNANISAEYINILLSKKNNRLKMNRNSQAPTIVTLPDDFISPYVNRIFTVRELARLQSFDDSFEFLGKRTTGGDRRKSDVPQYSQVGNAVPPLLAKAVATEIRIAIEKNKP